MFVGWKCVEGFEIGAVRKEGVGEELYVYIDKSELKFRFF